MIGQLSFAQYDKVSINNINYYIHGSTASVAYSDYSGSLKIPSSITYNGKDYSVTSISDYAFYDCSGLTSVTIPNSVTSIGDYAFYGCSGLTSVTIPNSVTSIGNYAFAYCGLTSVTIPNSVTSIGSSAFLCSGLTSVTIPNSVTNIGESTFESCYGLTSVTIPNSVTTIGEKAFYRCSGLTSITIGNNVTSIGNRAFEECSSLTSVTIPNSVTNIGYRVFYNTKLKSVTIGSGVLSISNDAFGDIHTSSPVKVIWLTNTPPTNYSYAEGTVNYVANDLYFLFSNKKVYPFLSSIFTVDGVKYVPVSPSERTCDAIDFDYDASAENIQIGNNVNYKGVILSIKEINPYVCAGNTSVKSATIDYNGGIPKSAFQGCSSLNTMTLGENVTSIGDYAFDGCSELQSINIPNSVERVGSYAFHNCSKMQSITIGSNVKTIGSYAYSNCSALQSIMIPKAVTSIGHYAFNGCTALKNVVMEDSGDDTILSLGSNGSSPLFSSCPLDNVYIGRKLSYDNSSNKGYSPFAQNGALSTVEITDRETEILENEFYGCTNLKNIKFGDNITKINDRAFSGCSSLDYFVVGPKVENIGKQAFSGCSSMTKLFSRATTPPACGSQALDDINKWNCKLTIPTGSLAAYQAADQWKEFFFVEEGDMTPIDRVEADELKEADIIAIYDLNGQKKTSLQRGLNIVKMSDGRTKKIAIK